MINPRVAGRSAARMPSGIPMTMLAASDTNTSPRCSSVSRPKSGPDGLTAREVEVLCLVARGASNKQIAEQLVISQKTARNHVERAYAKIGASNRIGASMYALRHGLVSPQD